MHVLQRCAARLKVEALEGAKEEEMKAGSTQMLWAFASVKVASSTRRVLAGRFFFFSMLVQSAHMCICISVRARV